MIARSESEFETFQRMDLERQREEIRLSGPKSRLVEEEELPDWLVREDEEVNNFSFSTIKYYLHKY